jgi:putative ABC transport system ATP-binding protein
MPASEVTKASNAAPLVRCENLVHVYRSASAHVAALRGVDFTVDVGETVALLGPSGAGKSTLLWHLAGILTPTAGTVDVGGHALASLPPAALASFRLREIGVMLQNGGRNLVPYLSATDNVLHAQRPASRPAKAKMLRASTLLEAVGIGHVARRPAGQLSGGEQQRLALAVALANGPRLLLADEPTSQLDEVTAGVIIELIKTANRDFGTTVIVVTHDPTVSEALGRSVTIRDGRIGSEAHAGEDYVVVGREGVIHIPPELFDLLPPGSLARAVRTADGVWLERVDRNPDVTPPSGQL